MLDRDVQEEFRDRLRGELVARCKRNPRYSLRAYAASLSVQPSFLSKLLQGKRSITKRTIERFAEPLGLAPAERESLAQTMPILAPLSQETFQVISDWYHFAILELFTTTGFEATPAFVSRKLGISRVVAADALIRLERLGILGRDKKSKLILNQGENTTTSLGSSSPALRRLQRHMLEMAIEALEEIPVERRDQSTMTMAVDARLLPVAKQRIKEFRRSLCQFLQKNRRTDSVYHLTISLYPVTRAEKAKERS